MSDVVDPAEIEKASDYARAHIKVKRAKIQRPFKRVEYVLGSRIVQCFQSDEFAKHMGRSFSEDEAQKLARQVVALPNVARVARVKDFDQKKNRFVVPQPKAPFDPEHYFMWVGLKKTSSRDIVLAVALVAVIIAVCCIRLWPAWMRTGVSYLFLFLAALIISVSILRLVVFLLCWIAGFDVWILPNLYADVGFFDSFKPGLTVSKFKGASNLLYRGATLATLLGFGIWLYNQPTLLDELVASNKQFVEDLYSGTLLSDGSGEDTDHIAPEVPSLEELEREAEAGLFEDDAEDLLDKLVEEHEAETAEEGEEDHDEAAKGDAEEANENDGSDDARDEL